jgi:hypothetical protein
MKGVIDMFYILLIIITIMIILCMVFNTISKFDKYKELLNESFDNLKESWNKLIRQFK